MLSDPNEDVRKMAVDKILEYRQSERPEGVRTRINPALNKNAKKYYETIGKNPLRNLKLSIHSCSRAFNTDFINILGEPIKF